VRGIVLWVASWKLRSREVIRAFAVLDSSYADAIIS
jgi:hypothetical protein